MAATPINFAAKLALFDEAWTPKVIAELNDYQFKLVKLRGDFVWHSHPDTDEAFIVLAGRLTIELRDGDVRLGPGEMYVVPRGVEHRPVAGGEAQVLLVEPRGVVNTGEAASDLTAPNDAWI
jgi:mannose-6-phosphate isomerase-like protein (cupin superfamily)